MMARVAVFVLYRPETNAKLCMPASQLVIRVSDDDLRPGDDTDLIIVVPQRNGEDGAGTSPVHRPVFLQRVSVDGKSPK